MAQYVSFSLDIREAVETGDRQRIDQLTKGSGKTVYISGISGDIIQVLLASSVGGALLPYGVAITADVALDLPAAAAEIALDTTVYAAGTLAASVAGYQ